MLCGKNVKTIDSGIIPCICKSEHEGGCNPFSDNPFLLKENPASAPTLKSESREEFERDRFGTAGPIKQKEFQQCFWQGAHGRCTLEYGHFPKTPHKEDKE